MRAQIEGFKRGLEAHIQCQKKIEGSFSLLL